ncbi:hypothetical protein DFH27DRAFT_521108 [Peziza echinospora]|nr:hypothetical protein DFH27DRAFT_521108 [Peziza echinospora]
MERTALLGLGLLPVSACIIVSRSAYGPRDPPPACMVDTLKCRNRNRVGNETFSYLPCMYKYPASDSNSSTYGYYTQVATRVLEFLMIEKWGRTVVYRSRVKVGVFSSSRIQSWGRKRWGHVGTPDPMVPVIMINAGSDAHLCELYQLPSGPMASPTAVPKVGGNWVPPTSGDIDIDACLLEY